MSEEVMITVPLSDAQKQEEIEFWEWCGLVQINNPMPFEASNSCEAMTMDRPINGWYKPDYKKGTSELISLKDLPVLDLNNLFRYAVPKLDSSALLISKYRLHDFWTVRIGATTQVRDKDPAQALYQAIQEVRKSC